jgi:hypothetical protein
MMPRSLSRLQVHQDWMMIHQWYESSPTHHSFLLLWVWHSFNWFRKRDLMRLKGDSRFISMSIWLFCLPLVLSLWANVHSFTAIGISHFDRAGQLSTCNIVLIPHLVHSSSSWPWVQFHGISFGTLPVPTYSQHSKGCSTALQHVALKNHLDGLRLSPPT